MTGEPADRATDDCCPDPQGDPPRKKAFPGPGLRENADQQTAPDASAGSKQPRSPDPPTDGASSSPISLTDDELDRLTGDLDAILEHRDLLEEIGVADELNAHRSRLEAERQGWLQP